MMQQSREQIALGKYAQWLINKKIYQLTHRADFSLTDDDDLRQRFTLHLWRQADKFDPEIGDLKPFIKAVVERYAAFVVRAVEAGLKNGTLTHDSLNEEVLDEDQEWVDRSEVVTEDRLRAHHCYEPRDRFDAVDLKADEEAAISQLPPDLQDVCRRLKSRSVAEVAEDLGIPRSTLYEWIAHIRKHFEQAGLDKYL